MGRPAKDDDAMGHPAKDDVTGHHTEDEDVTDEELEEAIPFLDIDEVCRRSKSFGRYQLLQVFLINFTELPAAAQILSMVFLAYEPEHTCNKPPDYFPNTTIRTEKCSIKYFYGNETNAYKEDSCIYGNNYSVSADSSVLLEWDLLCERRTLGQLPMMLVLAGQATGAALSFIADKIGRRKLLLLSQLGIMASALAGTYVPDFYAFAALRLVAGSFQQGLVIPRTVLLLESVQQELRPYVVASHGFFWTLGQLNLAFLSYIFEDYGWKNISVIVSMLSLLGILQFFFMDESVRWLIGQNHYKEAAKVIRRTYKFNGVPLSEVFEAIKTDIPGGKDDDKPKKQATDCREPPDGSKLNGVDKPVTFEIGGSKAQTNKAFENENIELNYLKGNVTTENKAETGDVFTISQNAKNVTKASLPSSGSRVSLSSTGKRKSIASNGRRMSIVSAGKAEGFFSYLWSPRILRDFTFMIFTWFIDVLVYFGLYLVPSLSITDIYINFISNALVEVPSVFLLFYVMHRFSRRGAGIVLHTASGIMLVTATALYITLEQNSWWVVALITTCSLSGKMINSAAFRYLFVYTPEIFPTNIRPTGTGVASFFGRIGGILAPYSFTLADYVAWGPATIFGAGSLLAGLFFRFVPETKNKELAQLSAEQVIEWIDDDVEDEDDDVQTLDAITVTTVTRAADNEMEGEQTTESEKSTKM